MKNTLKRIAALSTAALLTVAMAVPVFAQDVPGTSADNATITIDNAAKGETYSIYKLFDATVTGEEDGSIAYQGTIPESLKDYFTQDKAGNISATDAAKAEDGSVSDDLKEALKTWADSQTATASVESDGSDLNFKGLDYGYYVVETTQGENAITVDSTNPNAKVVDKNSTTPVDGLAKTVDDTKVYVGQTVTYTISFDTSNYNGAGADAKQIVTYTIEDTLPDFLSDVNVTNIIVDNDADLTTTDDQKDVTAQFTDKAIDIAWATKNTDGTYTNLYDNGAKIVITYTATVNDNVAIAGAGNKNEVTVTIKDADNTPITPPEGTKTTDDETIYSYAAAIQKVNSKGEALADAIFSVPYALTQTSAGSETEAAVYTVTGTGTTEVTTPASGVVIIKGVDENTFEATETAAPNGYNKLTSPVSITPSMTAATTTSTTTYLDADGNVTDTETTTVVTYTNSDINTSVAVVVNKTGAELPSTGGIGTTIFYIIGGCIIVAAVIVLVVRKRRFE